MVPLINNSTNLCTDYAMSLLKTFVSYTSTTLKRFIFTAALIVSAVTFGVVIIVVSCLWPR